MAIDPLFLPEGEDTPIAGGYAQPGPGITEQIVVLADTAGVALATAAGTASVAVLTVQGSASGTAIPVSGTITAGGVAQGSTTSGQTGTLVQGAVTSAVPAYTTAQTDPLSMDTSGRLRGFHWNYRDSIVTVQVGSVSSAGPTAGTVIATCTPGTAGLWEVTGLISVTGTSVIAVESNNMGLYQTAAAVITNIPMPCSTAGSGTAVKIPMVTLNLSGVDTVNIKAIASATVTAVYAASLVARRVG